jgi:hypothetical protein
LRLQYQCKSANCLCLAILPIKRRNLEYDDGYCREQANLLWHSPFITKTKVHERSKRILDNYKSQDQHDSTGALGSWKVVSLCPVPRPWTNQRRCSHLDTSSPSPKEGSGMIWYLVFAPNSLPSFPNLKYQKKQDPPKTPNPPEYAQRIESSHSVHFTQASILPFSFSFSS